MLHLSIKKYMKQKSNNFIQVKEGIAKTEQKCLEKLQPKISFAAPKKNEVLSFLDDSSFYER